jgi:hypothetical protein
MKEGGRGNSSRLVNIITRVLVVGQIALTAAIRKELAALDLAIPLRSVRVFDEYISRSLARPRFNALLLSIFAGWVAIPV